MRTVTVTCDRTDQQMPPPPSPDMVEGWDDEDDVLAPGWSRVVITAVVANPDAASAAAALAAAEQQIRADMAGEPEEAIVVALEHVRDQFPEVAPWVVVVREYHVAPGALTPITRLLDRP